MSTFQLPTLMPAQRIAMGKAYRTNRDYHHNGMRCDACRGIA